MYENKGSKAQSFIKCYGPVPIYKVVFFFNSILKTSGNSKDMSYAFGGQSDGWWNMKEERETKQCPCNVNYIWKSRTGCERSFLLDNKWLVVVEKKLRHVFHAFVWAPTSWCNDAWSGNFLYGMCVNDRTAAAIMVVIYSVESFKWLSISHGLHWIFISL